MSTSGHNNDFCVFLVSTSHLTYPDLEHQFPAHGGHRLLKYCHQFAQQKGISSVVEGLQHKKVVLQMTALFISPATHGQQAGSFTEQTVTQNSFVFISPLEVSVGRLSSAISEEYNCDLFG
ncbi:hypothetical protein Pmani_007535 [Petrolisthes manimaculis]|uniref:Uncharacterized protein n=1 Tax=Petrolisthes manimaculis TaxID=1843537 RepID=A0AAE1Q8E1_9EUCA|nr:hypothetical protein Pmani_007535 [Petrolisthes manimaculis]